MDIFKKLELDIKPIIKETPSKRKNVIGFYGDYSTQFDKYNVVSILNRFFPDLKNDDLRFLNNILGSIIVKKKC